MSTSLWLQIGGDNPTLETRTSRDNPIHKNLCTLCRISLSTYNISTYYVNVETTNSLFECHHYHHYPCHRYSSVPRASTMYHLQMHRSSLQRVWCGCRGYHQKMHKVWEISIKNKTNEKCWSWQESEKTDHIFDLVASLCSPSATLVGLDSSHFQFYPPPDWSHLPTTWLLKKENKEAWGPQHSRFSSWWS